MQVCARFGMNNEALASGFYVSLCHDIRSQHHEVRFEWLGAVRAGRGNDVWAEGEVWYELAVHDVPLNNVNASLVESTNLLANLGKIGGED
jgi:hypothetical protein